MFSQIGRILFHVDHCSRLIEGIIGVAFGKIKSNSFILVESSSELISINDTEDSAVYIQIHAYIQIFPVVDFRFLSGDEYFVSLEEDALRDATVLNSILCDVQGVIFQIVVNSALADAVVFIRALNNGLLEVCLEVKYLK